MDSPQAAANERVPPIPTVYVYDVDLASAEAELGGLLKLLDDRELAQAQRFATPELKRKYVVSHGSVRLALGRYIDVLPSDIRFVEAPHGKPQLDPCHASEIQFNLSHSGEKCLIAISARSAVGIDIERIRPLEDWREISQRFFSEREYQRLLALPANLVNVAFFATWSRKEAYIKALGLGLALDLSAFEVEVDPRTEARLVWTRDASEGPARWAMRDIVVGPHYRAALAVRGQHCNVVRMEAELEVGAST